MLGDDVTFEVREARTLGLEACTACGASAVVSRSLVEATLSAEAASRPEVGFRHLVDYLEGFRDGRIAADAEPFLEQPLPAILRADAMSGIAQLGFDLAYDRLVAACRTFGVALFTQGNSYTAGELGYYVRRLAADGLVALASANGPALMAAAVGGKRVFCTNPLAFGAPCKALPLVIDQAASATAFVSLMQAAKTGTPLPQGWAIDETGAMTTDANAALAGALLPFGGYKGANIALMVEVLAAGLSGGSWSMDAGDFRSGTASPRAGLTVIAIAPSAIDPQFEDRLARQLKRLEEAGVHIPGMGPRPERIILARSLVERIRAFSGGA